jgi:hypothetical protein
VPLRTGHAFAGVDFDAVHRGKIDHHTAIAHAESGAIMASATHRDRQATILRKLERPGDIRRSGAAHDHHGMPIECAVED